MGSKKIHIFLIYIHTSSSLNRELDTGLLGCGVEAFACGGLGFDLAADANRSCKVTNQIKAM